MSKNSKILIATGLGAAILAAGVVVGVKYAKELMGGKSLPLFGKKEKEEEAGVLHAEGKVSKNKFIGDVKAKEIALTEAGVSVDEVEDISLKLDFEDGVWQYNVAFTEDGTLHSYLIKADDGAVLDWNAEFED